MLSLMLVSLALNGSYEMADLKALDKSGGWAELLEHLNDVAPSKRDKEWEGIAEHAAVGWMSGLELKEHNAMSQLEQVDGLLKKYPFFKTSKPVMQKRLDVAVKVFLLTYSNYRHSAGDDEWLTKVKAVAESDTVSPDAPSRLAKDVVLARLIPVTAFPLFKLSFERGNKGVCRDADFHKALIGTFDDGSWKADAEDLSSKCWDDVKTPLQKALADAKTNKFRRNVCPLLSGKNALPAAQKDACEQAQQ